MVQKKDFTNYLSSALQNSMVTGIPQIATAGNLPKKITRALVFVFCVAGFIYQSTTFMKIYWQYKTTIDVQVTYPRTADLPAFTVCNINGVKMVHMCTIHPNRCHRVRALSQKEFCDCLPRYCPDGVYPDDHQVMALDFATMIGLQNQSQYYQYLQTYDEFIKSATREMVFDMEVRKINFTDYKQIRCPSLWTAIPGCFTFDSIVEQPDKEIAKINPDGATTLELDLMVKEYYIFAHSEVVYISFHNARTIVNPFIGGFMAYAGKEYKFRLKKTVKELLPPPYETMCKDYITLWKQRGGKGPTNEKECIQECEKNVSISVLGCIVYGYSIPSNHRRCDDYDERRFAIEKEVKQCVKEHCRPACWEEMYDAVVDEYDIPTQAICTKEEIRKNNERVKIRISYNGMQTTTFKYKPQFEDIETFSYLGGYVGMWLGISLVAVFDFVETVVIMLKYPLGKLRNNLFQNSRRKTRVIPHNSR